MPDLVRTWFSPYRQTFAGGGRGGFDAQIRAFSDNIISRCIGFVVRSVLIFTGSMFCLASVMVGVCALALWPFIPLTPLVGVLLIGRG